MTTPENQRVWWSVDNLSAKAANSYSVRRTLRSRSRHEVSNNPYLYGVVNSNADDLIDTGPTLQVRTKSAAFNRAVESAWNEWCAEVNLTEKLRTCKLAKGVDGEGFLILKTVSDLESPVKLYPVDVEADQVTTPAPGLNEMWVDGLTLHPVTGQPTHYHVLKHHPGDY
ncbi:MAG TPA: phage portal protein, partial [Gemmata sp.]